MSVFVCFCLVFVGLGFFLPLEVISLAVVVDPLFTVPEEED